MAANDRAVIFVSSSMSELPDEREIVKQVVAKLGEGTFETYLFEEDAVPDGTTPQDEWRRQLLRTSATVALLYQKFGQYTEEEIRLSREQGIPVLLFRKSDSEKLLEGAAPEFVEWLQDAETGVTTKWFETPKELKDAVKQALQKQIMLVFQSARGARREGSPTSVDGMDVQESKAPKIERRVEPGDQLPPQRFFVGRDDDQRMLLDAIETAREDGEERYILLVGPPGIGKEALLRHLTHSGDLPAFPDGTAIAPNWRNREDTEDLLQALWEQFYDPDDTVDPRTRDRQLKDVEALVFLPDLDDAEDITDVVQRSMPRSVFCGTVVDFDALAEPIPVDELTDEDAICAIFEKSYKGTFPDQATRAMFAELCRMQGGNPGKVELLGKQAKLKARPDPKVGGPHPLIAWVADAAREEGLTPCAPRLMAVVSEIGHGVHAPQAVLELVVPSESVEEALAAGCIEAASPRYRLNPVIEPSTDLDVFSDIFVNTLEWARTAPADEIFANRAFVLQMMARGLEDKRWAEVIALGRSTETAIALGARHGAWKELLESVGHAATASEDEVSLSWALHQLGSRSLLRDDLGAGRSYLFESLRHRKGDEDARKLTRGNLMLLPAAVIPFAALVLVPLVSILAVIAILLPEERSPNLDVAFGTVVLPTGGVVRETEQLEVWKKGEQAVELSVVIDNASVNGSTVDAADSGFCIVVDDLCVDGQSAAGAMEVSDRRLCPPVGRGPRSLTVLGEEPCVLVVGFSPDVTGDHAATLRVEIAGEAAFEGKVTGTATAAIVDIDPDFLVFPTDEPTFRLTNVGTVAIEIGEAQLRSIGGDIGATFQLDREPECDDGSRTIEPGGACLISVEYLGGTESAFLDLEISVVSDPTQQILGDVRVLLIGKGDTGAP